MSSILKALEKVEDAQNPRRHGGAQGLARGRERRSAWLIPAWALGGATVAALATFAAMGGFSRNSSKVVQAKAEVPIVDAAAPQQARPSALPAKQPKSAKSAGTQKGTGGALQLATKSPTQAKQAGAKKEAHLSAKEMEAHKRESQAHRKEQASSGHGGSGKESAAKGAKLPAVTAPRPAAVQVAPVIAAPAAPVHPEVAQEKPRQALRVTGIAWQNDGASSFAMVNGRPVRQGAVVDGMRVEQIHPDSVKFSGSNGSIVVPLGAGEE